MQPAINQVAQPAPVNNVSTPMPNEVNNQMQQPVVNQMVQPQPDVNPQPVNNQMQQQYIPQQQQVQQPVPNNDNDINSMIAQIEADTVAKQDALRGQIMSEAEQRFNEKLTAQNDANAKIVNDLKQQVEALTQAKNQQVNELVESYKTKLSELTTQTNNIQGELDQRQSNVSQESNPFKQAPQEQSEDAGLTNEVDQERALQQMYSAINGRKF